MQLFTTMPSLHSSFNPELTAFSAEAVPSEVKESVTKQPFAVPHLQFLLASLSPGNSA